MKYTVLWKLTAENALATFWVEADPELRRSITDTINAMDSGLKNDPYSISESREGTERIAIESPLVLAIDVREQDQQVIVLSIRIVPEQPRD